jgi:acyl-homoserine lactone acylase PvdQ
MVIGRTAPGEDRDALAWTVTSGRDDMIDTVAVELDPDDRHRYRWDGEWHTMRTETVTHVASPVPPALDGEFDERVVEQEVARIEEDGATMPVVAWNPDEDVAYCQRVTTRSDELTGAFRWAALARATDLDDLEGRLETFPFTFNFHVVSESGDVGYYHTGRVPERADGPDYRFPVPEGEHGWRGTANALEHGTSVRNPSRGYVVNWNNGPAAGWRAGDMEQNWGSIHRVEELNGFIRAALGVPEDVADGAAVKEAAGKQLSVDDVKTIVSKAALHDATATETYPPVVRAAEGADDDRVAEMGSLLADWIDDEAPWNDEPLPPEDAYEPPTHGDDVYEHPGHAIYDESRKRLQASIFGDEFGERNTDLDWDPAVSRHAAPHGTAWDDVTFNDVLHGDTDHDWLDGPLEAVVREALADAADALEAEYDTADPSEWLKTVHESVFRSVGATRTTTMDMRNRASYNQAISIGLAQSDDPTVWQANAGDVLPPANSGLITGPELVRSTAGGEDPARVTDQQELYVTNRYKPHPVTRAQVEAVATESETIQARAVTLDGPVAVDDDVPDDRVLHLYRGGDGH